MARTNYKRSRSNDRFPTRLHDTMEYAEAQGLESVIGWVLRGHGFMIYNPNKLMDILSRFFSQTKYKSFLRQLNMWDFERIAHGHNKGTYMHPYFVRGNRELSKKMIRQVKPSATKSFQHTTRPMMHLKTPASDSHLGTSKSEINQCSQRLPNYLSSLSTAQGFVALPADVEADQVALAESPVLFPSEVASFHRAEEKILQSKAPGYEGNVLSLLPESSAAPLASNPNEFVESSNIKYWSSGSGNIVSKISSAGGLISKAIQQIIKDYNPTSATMIDIEEDAKNASMIVATEDNDDIFSEEEIQSVLSPLQESEVDILQQVYCQSGDGLLVGDPFSGKQFLLVDEDTF